MSEYPLPVSIAVVLVAFALGHAIPARAYKAGKKPTIIVGAVCVAFFFLFLILGFEHPSLLWKNVFGLCAGICLWVFYGEVLETLQGEFGVTTGVEVNHGNLPVLVVLAGTGALLSLRYGLLAELADRAPALLQALNAFYVTWLLHVVLLTVYYAPVFGGPTVAHGERVPAIKVWTRPRIVAAFAVGLFYAVVAIPFAILEALRSVSPTVKVACGFYLVILSWSVLMELRQKLFQRGA